MTAIGNDTTALADEMERAGTHDMLLSRIRDEAKVLRDAAWSGIAQTLLDAHAAITSLHHQRDQSVARLRAIPVRALPPALDRETIQTLLDLLNPLHGSLDEQVYEQFTDERELDAPPDREYGVNVTAQQERDLTQAVKILENRLRDPQYVDQPTLPTLPTLPMASSFVPNETARAAFRAMDKEAGDVLMEQFFALWEAEGDARRAGSMAAHAYIRNAARIAVFGAECAGHEPEIGMWRATCDEQFEKAVNDVATAFAEAEADDTPSVTSGEPCR